MRVGLVGYGTGGRHFHAPFIAAARGVELAGVVARAPATVAKVRADLPGVAVFRSLSAMLKSGVDAVTITTSPQMLTCAGPTSSSYPPSARRPR